MIHWQKDESDLILRDNVSISYKEGHISLIISKAQEVHSGRYSCTAKNVGGVSSSVVDLVVQCEYAIRCWLPSPAVIGWIKNYVISRRV